MIDINFDEFKAKADSVYQLARLAGKRAEEICQGSQQLVDAPLGTKATTIALKEICENKVSLKKIK